MGIKIELHRQPAYWSNGVEKAKIRGDWTVIPRVGDRIGIDNIHCYGDVRSVTWVAPDTVVVMVWEEATRRDPEEDKESENG